MSAITQDTQRPANSPVGGFAFKKLPMLGYTSNSGNNRIFHGSIVFSDISLDTGAAAGYFKALSGTPASGDIFGGIASENQLVDSSQLTNGLRSVQVHRDGVHGFPKASCTIADVGKPAYATTDGDIQTSSSSALWIGRIEDVDATYVWVNIEPAFLHLNTAN